MKQIAFPFINTILKMASFLEISLVGNGQEDLKEGDFWKKKKKEYLFLIRKAVQKICWDF